MSSSKAVLRSISDDIRQQRFDEALEKVNTFLQKEPKNYQGHIFLAFTQDKLGKTEEAENVYRAATVLRPKEPQAWQGLVKLFEKQGTKKLAPYQEAVVNLAHIYHDAEDMYKCQEVADKFIDYVRDNGDKLQYADALWLQLPESPIYSILQGRFPPPAHSYERIAGIIEDFEKKRINTLIGERRTKLGATRTEVTLEAKREVYAQSKLEHIYRQLINWLSDDDVRRQYEEKLLQYCHDHLLVLQPGEQKDQERQKVFGLANDMVAINYPYKFAWDIALDWQDKKDIAEYDVSFLRTYCSHFPDSDLYKIITSFLTSTLSPFPPAPDQESTQSASVAKQADDESSDDDDGGVPTFVVPLTDDDRLIMMTEGVLTLDSTFGYRLAGQYFIHVGEYESTVEFMRKAREHLAQEQRKLSVPFQNTEDSYLLSLGTALVYHQSPRHHATAKSLFDKVLAHDATSTPALLGVGLIYEEEEEFDQAIDFLGRALERDSSNIRIRSELAWVKALKGDWARAREELDECIQLLDTKAPPKELLAELQYRVGVCLWNVDSSKQARKQRKGDSAYAFWLLALKNNPNLAPAYTNLGLFYADYAKDKKRSRRCFQKALELSASEVTSAEYLARSFADDGDWDRVELVAQRIVDSGKVKPPPGSKRKGISWPFAALGVAELNKQDFHKAIVSFQSALRLSPEDYHSWVGLGESYHSSGRFVAATKAILNAQKLEEETESDISGDTWFTKYMLANIKRELGEFDEAIELYQSVVETHSQEEGVILALMQTMVDNALTSIEKGHFGKAVQLATDTIQFATKIGGGTTATFNYWKSLGDACSVFVQVQSLASKYPRGDVKVLLEQAQQEGFDILAKFDKVNIKPLLAETKDDGDDVTQCAHAMILCYKQAIHVTSNERHAQAIGYYNLGWAEEKAHSCLGISPAASSNFIKASIRAFKRAIELEAGNADFWNAMGAVTSHVNPAVAQHAFSRSLYINERNPVAWTNLGALALLSGDVKFANEAFTRSQSTDPDYAHAWLGQGFVALMYGDAKEARGLFTHAMGIAEASSLPIRQHYSAAMFDHILAAPPNLNIASLIQPLFALTQVQSQRPQALGFGHLATLFEERTNDAPRAVRTLEEVCATLEAEFEKSESPESLARITLAKTDLARAYLAQKLYDKAVECGEMALGLSSDDTDSELQADQRKKARLSAHLTVGLAQYYLHQFDDALTYFEAALEESEGNPDAVCLLTQVLWAQGTDEARERARDALFEVIEKHPDHVQSVLLLDAIALVDEDEDSLEAVVESLEALRTSDKVLATEQSHISEVLRAIAAVGSRGDDETGNAKESVKTQTQTDVMLYPHLPHGWSSLAETVGDEYSAQMALSVAKRGIPPRGLLESQHLSKAYAGTGQAGDAQRAVLLAPWEAVGWDALRSATGDLVAA